MASPRRGLFHLLLLLLQPLFPCGTQAEPLLGPVKDHALQVGEVPTPRGPVPAPAFCQNPAAILDRVSRSTITETFEKWWTPKGEHGLLTERHTPCSTDSLAQNSSGHISVPKVANARLDPADTTETPDPHESTSEPTRKNPQSSHTGLDRINQADATAETPIASHPSSIRVNSKKNMLFVILYTPTKSVHLTSFFRDPFVFLLSSLPNYFFLFRFSSSKATISFNQRSPSMFFSQIKSFHRSNPSSVNLRPLSSSLSGNPQGRPE